MAQRAGEFGHVGIDGRGDVGPVHAQLDVGFRDDDNGLAHSILLN